MKHPILYDKTATNFFNLGIGVLTDAISCIVIEERNGVFELEMEYPLGGALFHLLENDLIIKADAGHALSSKDQLFRIKRIDKTIDKVAKVYAEHVSYLARELPFQPIFNILNQSGNTVLNTWRNALVGNHPFTSSSNITALRSTNLTIQDYNNPRQILGGIKGSILDVWGGEYRFDNYHINLLNQRGGNANTLIAYGRNLTDLSQEENITNTFTSVYPFAIFRNSYTDNEEIITINGFVVDSQHVNAFPNRRVLPIDFSSEFESDVRPTQAKLRELAEAYIRNNQIGVPRVSISLSFVDLTKTLNYNRSRYEELNLCDTVPIYFDKLGIRTRAKIVRIEWDVLLDQYKSLEIGELRPTISDTIRDIERDVNNANNNSNYALTAANGRNTVFFGPNEPRANRVGDLWYRSNGEDTELWMWNGAAWEFVMSTAPDSRILDKIEDLEREIDEAQQESQRALELAQEAFDKTEPLFNITDPSTGQVTTITALALGLQTTVTDNYASTQSRITQLASDINLRVEKGDVVSQINLSPETIRIQARRIHLSGETLIDNAVIRDAHIHSLNAAKITTGTLNAANVNLINMNAANITTGFLNAARIQARSITADHLAANAITVGFNNLGNTLQLSSTAITFNTNATRAGMLTSTGLQYWWGTRAIGGIRHQNHVNNTNIRGLSMHLNNTGDYLAFGRLPTATATTVTTHFLLDPQGNFTNVTGDRRTGIHAWQRLHVHEMGTTNTTGGRNFVVQNFNATWNGTTHQGVYIGSANGNNGIIFASGRLLLQVRGVLRDISNASGNIG